MRRRLLVTALMAACALGAVLFVAHVRYGDFQRQTNPRDEVLQVPRGWSWSQVADALAQEGVVDSASWFRVLARLTPGATLKAGEYALPAGLTPGDIVGRLSRGEVLRHPLRLIEGWSLARIRQAFLEAGLQDPLTVEMPELPAFVPEPSGLEGLLFPDTYLFERGTSAAQLLRLQVARMGLVLEQAWAGRPAQHPLDRYQTLVLASIIEKETALAAERPVVSAVFHNRLKRGMMLQSDPTVIYGIADYAGDITREHLRTDTPYNTYTRKGLPPTPICSPGAASIQAALHPAQTRALYFVARGDGGHVFAETYEEHSRNVRDWVRRQAEKSP
ncbi:MAG: endolytic transglycosylase MltG [Magnetococcus sp. WYHC-3]